MFARFGTQPGGAVFAPQWGWHLAGTRGRAVGSPAAATAIDLAAGACGAKAGRQVKFRYSSSRFALVTADGPLTDFFVVMWASPMLAN